MGRTTLIKGRSCTHLSGVIYIAVERCGDQLLLNQLFVSDGSALKDTHYYGLPHRALIVLHPAH